MPTYSEMRKLFQRHISGARSFTNLIEKFRDPGNEKFLGDFRKSQSEIMSKRGVIESCQYYPEADITQK